MELTRLIELLADPAAYSYPVEDLEVHQTHISAVFLAGDFVYKLKRAVRFNYIDYSTRDLQESAMPAQVLQILKDGNERFRAGRRLNRDLGRQVEATAAGQHPLAVVLSCIDSRTPAELVFDLGVGDVFSVRRLQAPVAAPAVDLRPVAPHEAIPRAGVLGIPPQQIHQGEGGLRIGAAPHRDSYGPYWGRPNRETGERIPVEDRRAGARVG